MKRYGWLLSLSVVSVMGLSTYGCKTTTTTTEADDDEEESDDDGSSSSGGKSSSGSSGGKSSSSSSGGKSSSSSGGSSSGGSSSGGSSGGSSSGGPAGTCPGNDGPVGYDLAPTSGTGDCTTAQIAAFSTACLLAGATDAGCTAYVEANGVCADCLSGNATEFGAVVPVTFQGQEQVVANRGGCWAKLAGGDAACFAAAANTTPCVFENCKSCAEDDFDACATAVQSDSTNGCGQLLTTANDCLAGLDDATAAQCGVDTDTFAQTFTKVAAVLCGPAQ